MKDVYFACSIRGGRDDADTYAALVSHIKTRANVLSEIFANGALTAQGSAGTSQEIYATDIAWVHRADAVIAEVTNPSLGVGYEIAKAEDWNKPVLALFRNDGTRRLSAMIDGAPGVRVVYYKTVDEALAAINVFIAGL